MKKYAATGPHSLCATLLLAYALAVPGLALALPTDFSDADAPSPGRTGIVSDPSPWDNYVTPGSVVKPMVSSQAPSAPERAVSANPLWAIPLTSLSNTRERPIFSPSRRPPPPAVAAMPATRPPPPPPKPPRMERPPLSLVGTIAGDDQSFAIFVDQTTRAAMRLRLGEEYQGWKLRSVRGREVTLVRDEQSATLNLPQPGTGTAAPSRVQAESTIARGSQKPPDRAEQD